MTRLNLKKYVYLQDSKNLHNTHNPKTWLSQNLKIFVKSKKGFPWKCNQFQMIFIEIQINNLHNDSNNDNINETNSKYGQVTYKF